jgi:hypothetical protein
LEVEVEPMMNRLALGRLAGRTAASVGVFSPTEENFIRLPLDPAARGGEISAAAVKLIESLRKRAVKAEHVIPSSERAEKSAIEKAAEVRLTFGKHKGKPLADIPGDYLRWALDNVGTLSHAERSPIRLILTTEAVT